MKIRIRRIEPGTLAAVLGALYFLIGIFIGLFGLGMAIKGAEFSIDGPVSFSGSGTPMILLSIAYPLITGLTGAISGLIIAFFYNLVSRYIGGVALEIQTDESAFLR